ncbi:MAG: hypothetical protein Q9195_000239 [Heterodermia aff. obscurata]
MTRSPPLLRPCLRFHRRPASRGTPRTHLRLFSAADEQSDERIMPGLLSPEWRRQSLKGETHCPQSLYPQYRSGPLRVDAVALARLFGYLQPGATAEKLVTVNGRVWQKRSFSKNLTFLDLSVEYHRVQIVCNYSKLEFQIEAEIFRKAYANLEDLIAMTEKLIVEIDLFVSGFVSKPEIALLEPDIKFTTPFRQLKFLPTIEACLKEPLPILTFRGAEKKLLAIFDRHKISRPAHPTLPSLLDRLASEVIEPLCQDPTFITQHPECLAPLAKSFKQPGTGQRVAASAELFVKGREIANMYEEENSPFEQRRKFEEARKYKEATDDALKNSGINESYLEALEWGLPPTGGWGCGIDRLVMLFTGARRIGDVLTFGTLRNVVNLGSAARSTKTQDELAETEEK